MAPHPPHTQLALTTIPAGAEIPFLDGSATIAFEDIIIVTVLQDGEPTGTTLQLTPDDALALAQALTQQAGAAIGNQVNDRGQKLSPLERLTRFADAYRNAGS